MPTGRQYFAECREVDGMLCGASEDETAFGVWLESLLGRSSREHSGQDGGDVNPSAAANSSRFTVTPAPCLDAMGKNVRSGENLMHSAVMKSSPTSLQFLCDPLDRDQSAVPIGADLLQPPSGLAEL